jgi:hypothetical protein
MKRLLGAVAMVAGVLVTSSVSASDNLNTTIVEVRVAIGNPSVAVIEIDRDPAAIPSCATYTTGNNFHGRWFAMALNVDGGREALHVATAAQLAGKKVRVTGTGGCLVNTNKEDLSAVYMQN